MRRYNLAHFQIWLSKPLSLVEGVALLAGAFVFDLAKSFGITAISSVIGFLPNEQPPIGLGVEFWIVLIPLIPPPSTSCRKRVHVLRQCQGWWRMRHGGICAG